jgi:hypothetical protein
MAGLKPIILLCTRFSICSSCVANAVCVYKVQLVQVFKQVWLKYD